MPRKNILILSPSFRPNVGGAETYLDSLCEYLRTHDYYVYVLTYQPLTTKAKGQPIERKDGLEIHRFWWIGFNLFHWFQPYPVLNFIYLTPYLFLRSFLFLLFHSKKIDTIDAQGLSPAFIAKFLKMLFKKRAVMSTMALYNFQEQTLFAKVVKWTLSPLDKILAESRESKNELMKIGLPEEKIAVFNHWVDQNRFRPRDKDYCKEKLGWQNKFVVLFVGRAIPIKGAAALIEVAKKSNKRIYFAFISDAGPQVSLLAKVAQEIENVMFIGGVSYQDLHLYYNAADIFVIPSQYEEGVARVMLEAVSSGTPVVASNRGAIPSVLDQSVAILVEPTVEELGKAIEYLYNNPTQIKRLADNCRTYAEKMFSFNNAKVITSHYDEP